MRRLDCIAEKATLAQLADQLLHLGRAEEDVDLGQRIGELVLVALDHAADRDDGPAISL